MYRAMTMPSVGVGPQGLLTDAAGKTLTDTLTEAGYRSSLLRLKNADKTHRVWYTYPRSHSRC